MEEWTLDPGLPRGVPQLVVAAALCRNGKILISQRPQEKPGAGFWEFPGGKVEPGEELEDALRRELEEELGVIAGEAQPVCSASDTRANILLRLFLCESWEGEPAGREGQAISWVSLDALEQREMLKLDDELVPHLRAILIRS